MSWLWGGVAYDVCKWTVKKGIEGWKEAWKISQNAHINQERYKNDPEFRKQCDKEWDAIMQRDIWE